MIEMLGVLAIIGVLSVGGIAGYSKAMTKFKVNKTIEQISQIAVNVRTLFKSQGNYSDIGCLKGNSYVNTICQKAKLAPDDVFQGTTMVNPFGGYFEIEGYGESFVISYFGVPEDACMELATIDWGSTTLGLAAVGVNEASGGMHYKGCASSSSNGSGIACAGSEINGMSIPLSVSKAATFCSGNNNLVRIAFY